ncbi:oligosaccharide flippase family protein [Alteromonas sp. W364]|uniref:oligosaccharide flippase family protein n=1 Tax=Alteromonas sp. W364 TaxID=3075610 RepID=UPI002884579F|nr:oligosaccharide flippase family protein [Alteromonas sp. W364]MDT0628979.1 oligosaccharide flippase family protein [Alteromonas sp. W364]
MQVSPARQRMARLAWLFIEKFGLIFLSIFSFFAFALLLTPNELGLAVLLLAIAELFSFFFSSTIDNSMIGMKKISKSDDGTVFWTGLISTSILACVLWVLLSTFYFQEAESSILMVALLFLPLQSLSRIHIIHLRRAGEFKSLAQRTLLGKLLGLCCGIYVAYIGYGAWGLVTQAIVMSFTSASLLMLTCRRSVPFTFDIDLIKDLSLVGVPAAVKSISSNFVEKGLIFALDITLGSAAVGFFNFANRLVQLPKKAIHSALMTYGHPVFSRKAKSESPDAEKLLSNFFLDATQIAVYLAAPIFIGFAIIGEALVGVIFPERWAAAASLILPISVMAAISFSLTFLPSILVAKKVTKKALIPEIITTIMAILFVFMTSEHYGLMSAVWALIIKLAIMLPINTQVITSICVFSVKRYLLVLLKPVLACGVLCGSLLAYITYLPLQDVIDITLIVNIGGFVYLGSVLALEPTIIKRIRRFVSE